MVDLSSASKWGDRVPKGTHLYQLIVRWADRLEATGAIGIVRCLIYGYTKDDGSYPLCQDEDNFPTTQNELETVAPAQRFIDYGNGKPSPSSWEHLMDKIRHINGDKVPIECIRTALNEGRDFIDKFILDFTNVHGKKVDVLWVLGEVDATCYPEEIAQLEVMYTDLKGKQSKWIK